MSANTIDVLATVRSVTARILRIDPSGIVLSSRFRGEHTAGGLGADSINLIEIAMMLEGELGITIADDELGHIVTVEDAVKCIEKHL